MSNDSHNLTLRLFDAEKGNRLVYLYLIPLIQKPYSSTYTWQDAVTGSDLKTKPIKVPYREGVIAYDFMRDYVRELERDYVRELDAYLKAAGLDDYELAEEEKHCIGTEIATHPFSLEELFTAEKGDYDLQQKDINGLGCYFINSGVENLGIKGKTDVPAKIFKANTITIDFWGNAYYRDFEYKLATHNHVFSLSGDVIKNREVGLFLVSKMSKFPGMFSYSNMATWNKLKDLEISLPVKPDGTPDFDYMERYIRAIEKTAIKDLVDWKNKELAATRQVIGE